MSIDALRVALADRYAVERGLGQGGMATVYLAHDLKHDRQVAIKVLKPELGAVLGAERFLAEIKVTANLQHPNLLPLFDSGAADGLLYYVMPYLEGETLRARLDREQQLPVDETLRLVALMAGALDYAHARGVVHRDLKPENILLQAGQPVIADFGIALAVAQAGGSRVTETGLSLGTPHYMSPEQASGDRAVDARSDQYALGAVTYEMLTGEPPHTGAIAQVIIARLMTEAPRSIRGARPAVPPALDQAVLRALAKSPADRFSTCSEFVHAASDVTAATPAAAPPRRGRTAIALGAASLLLLVAGWWWTTHHTSGVPSGNGAARALAVLPIVNAGGDSTREYLADGMTTELANALRQTPGLTVAGDLSTFRFKHSTLPPEQIARDLHVGMLLTGTLQSAGGRIRLQVQLNDATGHLLWSNRFDREMKDGFALQDEITSAIAGEMQVVLTPAATAVARAGRTENPEAHDLYLRGVAEKGKLSDQGLAHAVIYFKQALALDSSYAKAWAALAFAYDMQADVYKPSHEYHLLAKDAALRAVRTDSLLAEGHVLLGFELAAANWDLEAGAAEMRRGIALDPNAPDALFMFATFLGLTGHVDEGVSLSQRLLRLDPLSAMASTAQVLALAFGNRWIELLRQDSISKKLDPTVVYGDAWDGTALRELGQLQESVAAYQAFEAVTGGQPAFGLAITYGRMGKRDEAMRIIRALEAQRKQSWVDPDLIAVAYAGIGDKDHAMQWLEQGFTEKSWVLRFMMEADPGWLAGMHDDPRFVALHQRVRTTTFKE